MSKEDIKKAKAENAERIANIAYSGGGHIGQDDLETAFENGAEWRIESVWHRDEEEAEVGSLILIKSRQRNVFMVRFYGEWSEMVRKYVIKQWAYIEDLIPNKED